MPPQMIRYASVTLLLLAGIVFAWLDWPPHFEPALILIATLSALVFCVLYATLSHGAWIRTKYGRHLMVLTGGLALLGAHAMAVRLLGPWDWLGGAHVHRELIYVALAWQLVNRNILLVVSHVRGERRRKAELMRPVSHDETAGQKIARSERARDSTTAPY